jgi:hypothetical protein
LQAAAVASCAHQRLRRQHGAQAEGAVSERPLRHGHEHAADEGLVRTARAGLPVIIQVDGAVGHHAPGFELLMKPFVR